MLQRYSDELRRELQRHLPHRVLHFPSPVQSCAMPAGQPVLNDSAISWMTRTLSLDVWNVGVGLLTATFLIKSPARAGWATLSRDVEEARHILKGRLHELRISALDQVRTAVDAGELRAWRFPGASAEPDGQALWTHVTFLLEDRHTAPWGTLDATAETVTGGSPGPRSTELEPLAVRIGLDRLLTRQRAGMSMRAWREWSACTVVWGAVVDLDRRLLALGAEPRPGSVRGLERQMARMLAAYDHVRRVRGELESVAVHLSDIHRVLWKAYGDKWELATQLASIDAKLEAQEHVLTQITNTTTNRRARTLSTLVLAFTVASIVGVVSGLVNLSSVRLHWPTGLNLWLVTALVGLAVLLFVLLLAVVLRGAERPDDAPRQ